MAAQLPTLKLTYFPITARGEVTRLALTFGGIPFEDVRVGSPEFETLLPMLPYAQVPVLDVDGERFAQSMALARYAGRLAELYPPADDPTRALQIDTLLETLLDALNVFVDVVFRTKWRPIPVDVLAEKTRVAVEETLAVQLRWLENRTRGAFFLGDNDPCLADVFLFDVVTNDLLPSFPQLDMSPYPKLQTIIESIGSNPNVQAYLANHPK